MPLSTGATWPALRENFTAAAEDMTSKFEWVEGDRLPMSGGVLTTTVFNIGSSSYNWNTAYFNELNSPSQVFFNVNDGLALRAWGRFSVSGGTVTALESNGVSSITYNPIFPGSYTINISNWSLTSALDPLNVGLNYYPLITACPTNNVPNKFHADFSSRSMRNTSVSGAATDTSFSIIVCGRILYQG